MPEQPEKIKKEKDAFIKADKRDSGFRKAATLLILLGKDYASKIFAHLSEEEALGVAREIAGIKKIEEADAKKVLEEFGYMMRVKDIIARGGLEKAKEMLDAAFGKEKSEEFYRRILEKTVPHPFTFLNDLPFEQVVALIKDESSSVISVILSHIDPALSSRILTSLPADKQKEIVIRISRLDKIPPEVLRKTEDVLRDKVRTLGELVVHDVDGKSAIADILRHMNVSKERSILDDLAGDDPLLAEELEKRLFTPDVVHHISNKNLQKVLQLFEDKAIAVLLKGKDELFKERVLRNVSQRRSELVRAEFNGIGRILKSEVDKADTDFLNTIRDMANKGEIVIMEEDDEYIE